MDSTNKDIKDNLSAEIEKELTDYHETEETNSAANSIRESVIKYCSSISDQSEINKTEHVRDSKSSSFVSTKDEAKIENPSEKKTGDEEKSSKFEEIEESSSKCSQGQLNTPITSPVKRKSLQIAEDEIKRKRNTDNAKIKKRNDDRLTDSSNVKDAALHIDPSEKLEKQLARTVISIDDATIEQDLVKNQTDKSTIKCKITNTKSERDLVNSDISNLSESNEPGTSKETIPQQEEMRVLKLRRPRFIPVGDLENNPEFVQSQKQILESIAHQNQMLMNLNLESDKREVTITLKNKDPGVKIGSSDNLPEKFEKSDAVYPEIEETQIYSENESMFDKVKSPVKRKSTSHSEIKPKRSTDDAGEDSEENLAVVGHGVPAIDYYNFFARDELMVEEMTSYVEAEGRDVKDLSLEEKLRIMHNLKKIYEEDHTFLQPENERRAAQEIAYEMAIQEILENQARDRNPVALEYGYPDAVPLTQYPNESPDSSPPKNQPDRFSITDSTKCEEYTAKDEDSPKGIKDTRYLKKFYKQKKHGSFPADLTGDKASTSKIASKTDSEENKMQIIGDDGYPDAIPLTQYPNESPDSSPPKNQPDRFSKRDSTKCGEYTAIDEDSPKGIKDTRYLKKFYKQKKHGSLSADLTGDEASTPKIEPKTDSEDNKMQIIGDDPRILTRNSEDVVHEESEECQIIPSKDKLKENIELLEDKIEISANAPENKNSKEARKPLEAKSEHLKVSGSQKHDSPTKSSKKILRTDVKSPNRSKTISPTKEMQPPCTFISISPLEGLAARVISTASPISYAPARASQPPSSPARASQPPSSPARASQPPSSPARASQPPSSPARASQPPSSPARASQPPSSPARASLAK